MNAILRLLATSATILLLVSAASAASEKGGKGNKGGSRGRTDILGMADQLKLTDDQKTKIEDIIKKRDEWMKQYDEWVRKTLADLVAAKGKAHTKADQDKYERQMKSIEQSNERNTKAAEAAQAILDLLTPEQKAKWNAIALQGRVNQEFRVIAPTFTDEQKEKTAAVCLRVTGGTKNAADLRFDSKEMNRLLPPTIKEVGLTILTPEQVKDYTMAKSDEQKAKKKGH